MTLPHEAVRAYLRYVNVEAFPPRYNIAPTQPVAMVALDANRRRRLTLVRWGLIPGWVKDPAAFATLVNARAETAADKPSFRAAFRHRRCLVPADGFYEWLRGGGTPRPHLFRPRAGGAMAFAGLYEHWLGAEGSEIDTMAILTVPANATVAPVHDRMPAILPPDSFDAWLDCRDVSPAAAAELLRPAPDDLLAAVEVGREVNNARREGPQLQVPIEQTRLL